MIRKYWMLLASLCVVLVAFVMHLLVEYGVLDFGSRHNDWFFVFTSIGLGVIFIIRSVETKNRYNLMMPAALLLAMGILITVCQFTQATTHTVLLAVIVVCFVVFVVGVMLGLNNAEKRGKNSQEGYKTYAERKAEEEKAPKEEPVLPELKTFEDVNKK